MLPLGIGWTLQNGNIYIDKSWNKVSLGISITIWNIKILMYFHLHENDVGSALIGD